MADFFQRVGNALRQRGEKAVRDVARNFRRFFGKLRFVFFCGDFAACKALIQHFRFVCDSAAIGYHGVEREGFQRIVFIIERIVFFFRNAERSKCRQDVFHVFVFRHIHGKEDRGVIFGAFGAVFRAFFA